MCAKKYLMDTIHSNNLKSEYDKLISIFEECKIEYIPLDYFIISKKMDRRKLYRLIYILMDFDLLEKQEFIICNMCHHEVFYYEDKINQCGYCNEYFHSGDIVEKYRIKDWNLEK